MTREEAYKWLAEKLNIEEEKAHFSKQNQIQCAESIWFCQQLLNDNRRLDLDFGCDPITPLYLL